MFEPLAKQRGCQRTQCFFVFVGSEPFFSPLDLPLGGMEPVVSVPVVAMVALMPEVPELSVAVVLVLDGVGAVPVAVMPVPVVSVELVPVVDEVTLVSVTAVSVLAFSSFLQAPRRASNDRTTRAFLMKLTPISLGMGDVSGARSRGAIV